MFILNYNIVNLCNKKSKEIKLTTESLQEDLKNYSDNLDEDFKKIKIYLDNILYSTNLNLNIPKKEESININTISTNKKQNQNIINVKLSKNNSKSNQSTMTLDKNKSKENIPISHFQSTINEFEKEEHFDEINKRLFKYNNQIETFKKSIYNIIKKQGNLKEVEKQIKSYENTKQKGPEGLFSQRQNEKEKTNKSSTQTLQNENQKISYNNKDDVIINNPILEKYFALHCLDLYEKNFKITTKELQSSHADLIIKINEDEEMDFGKAIEGTNEIQIYEKKNNKMTRIPIKLTKNPFGYTKFPIGCRSLLIGDKLYISGGRDETNEYANVLIYERKRNKIRRIMDMNESRSYYTMIYTDIFQIIMIFGGENKSSVEIFDSLINRWVNLPCLNISKK